MKKISILFILVLFSIIVAAQKNIVYPKVKSFPIKNEELTTFTKAELNDGKGLLTPNVIGDTVLYENFSNPANWVIQNLGSGTKSWVIGNSTDPDAAQLTSYTVTFATWNPNPVSSNKFAYFDAVYYLLNPPVPTYVNVALEYNGTIDLSAYPGVGIQWNQNYKAFNFDKLYFEYSIDNGTIWYAAGADELFPNMEVNFNAPVFKYINLSNQIGSNGNVKIRFRWECNYSGTNPNSYGAGYGWMIDNVLLLGLSNNDLLVEKVFPRFYGLGYYSKLPDRQRMKITSVKSSVLNNGSMMQSDINTEADIRIQGSSVSDFIAFSSVPYSALYIGNRDTLTTDTFTYVTASGINKHIINCTATQAELEDHIADNSDTVTFSITDTVFARDRNYSGRFGPTRVSGSDDGDYSAVGYYLTVQDTVQSISVYIATGTKVNSQISGIISYYDSGNYLLEQISTNNYTILSTDINKWITLSFKPVFDGFSELLEAGKLYYAGIKYFWKTIAPTSQGIYVGTDKEVPFTSNDWGAGVNYFVKADGAIFGHLTEIPKIRLNVSYPHYLTGTPTITQNKNFTVIYPNPSAGVVYFNNKNVTDISVYNMIGACVLYLEKATEKLDLSLFPQGSYFVKFNDGKSIVTKKLNIIR